MLDFADFLPQHALQDLIFMMVSATLPLLIYIPPPVMALYHRLHLFLSVKIQFNLQ